MKIVYLLQNAGIASRTPSGWEAAVIRPSADGTYAAEDLEQVADADFLVVGLEPVDELVLSRAKRLKLIQRLGVGFDRIDLEAAERRRIPVCYMPDFNAASVAEHTIMLALALLRQIFQSTLLMKAGQWPTAAVAHAGLFDLQGKTLGLIGYGAIGRAVAERARAFDARILYHDSRGGRTGAANHARYVELDELLGEADIVSLHVPLTPQTERLIGRRELGRMKRTAFLINTARGAVTDETALAEALDEGVIAGAGVDVFADEPLDPRHPLRRCKNILLTPHTAGQTREAMERMVTMMLENIERVMRGEEPRYLVKMG